jgi:hypothetical protein
MKLWWEGRRQWWGTYQRQCATTTKKEVKMAIIITQHGNHRKNDTYNPRQRSLFFVKLSAASSPCVAGALGPVASGAYEYRGISFRVLFL